MSAVSVRPAVPPDGWRQLACRAALIGGAYLVGLHLASAAGALPDDGIADGSLGPACVGCHHGPDDDPPPDGGAPAPGRETLQELRREAGR